MESDDMLGNSVINTYFTTGYSTEVKLALVWYTYLWAVYSYIL